MAATKTSVQQLPKMADIKQMRLITEATLDTLLEVKAEVASPGTNGGNPLLSFGIELEGVLAFQGKMIEEHLMRTRPNCKLIRDISDDLEPSLRSLRYQQTRYNSWAVQECNGNPRGYTDEPLHIAQSLIASNPEAPPTHVHAEEEKLATFEGWHLSPEPNVPGIPRAQLHEALPDAFGPSKGEQQNWDS
ncbi:MAG: hypothetical protein Q9157_008157, partial [Trypethelium eluteriae]